MSDTTNERRHQTETKAEPLDAEYREESKIEEPRQRSSSEGRDDLIEDRRHNDTGEHHLTEPADLMTIMMFDDWEHHPCENVQNNGDRSAHREKCSEETEERFPHETIGLRITSHRTWFSSRDQHVRQRAAVRCRALPRSAAKRRIFDASPRAAQHSVRSTAHRSANIFFNLHTVSLSSY